MILNKHCFKILFISFCFLGCASKTKEDKVTKEENQTVDYFADNGFGNAVAIIQHPSGVYHKGITYVTYQGTLEDPYVASYNHGKVHLKQE